MSRLSICENCSIYDSFNKVCNGSLYVNPKTNEMSTYNKTDYVKGCGCYIPRKVLKSNSKCPAGKW